MFALRVVQVAMRSPLRPIPAPRFRNVRSRRERGILDHMICIVYTILYYIILRARKKWGKKKERRRSCSPWACRAYFNVEINSQRARKILLFVCCVSTLHKQYRAPAVLLPVGELAVAVAAPRLRELATNLSRTLISTLKYRSAIFCKLSCLSWALYFDVETKSAISCKLSCLFHSSSKLFQR